MCVNPLKGWKTKLGYVCKVTKGNVVAIRKDSCKGYISIYDSSQVRDTDIVDYIDIPCRSCLACYEQTRREWITRAVAEAQSHEDILFVTLTYNDDMIPVAEMIDEDGEIHYHHTLDYTDFQKFMKRLRKRFTGRNIRYMVCGEYGSHTFRPHYHCILYGLSLVDFVDMVPHSRSKNGGFLYSSVSLDDVWQKGYTLSADANTSTMAYVAGYVAKKADTLKGKIFYELTNVTPPFIRGSLKPALGSEWFRENIASFDSLYDYHSVPTSDEPVKIFLTSNWKLKYKNNLLKNSSFSDIVTYEDELINRRCDLLDTRFNLLDTDKSKDDYNKSLNTDFRNSSKRKRGVY